MGHGIGKNRVCEGEKIKMQKTITYKLAGVPTSITGQNKFAKKLQEYFREAEMELLEPVSIIINVCDSTKEMAFDEGPRFYAEGKGLQVNDVGFIAHAGRLQYRVDNLFVENEPVRVWLYYNERHGWRRVAKTFLTNINPYMIGREGEEERFIVDTLDYNALWWILALALLKYERAFVHSGMATKKGMGVACVGTGGCGKTSAVSEMLKEGWKYIAEDFGVICADGSIWQIPKRGAISAEDVSYGSELLVTLIDQLPMWEKVRWNYYTKKGANPIVAPPLEKIYGKNIAKSAKLWKLVCVVRSSNEMLMEKKVSVDEMAVHIMGASFRVIREMYNVLHNIHAVADETCRENFPLMLEIENRYCDIIRRALTNVEYSVLEVPLKVNPKLIKECVLQNFPE